MRLHTQRREEKEESNEADEEKETEVEGEEETLKGTFFLLLDKRRQIINNAPIYTSRVGDPSLLELRSNSFPIVVVVVVFRILLIRNTEAGSYNRASKTTTDYSTFILTTYNTVEP